MPVGVADDEAGVGLLDGLGRREAARRSDLCEAIYRKFGLSRTECVRLLELVLKEVTDCLERGETVKLSSFGSFVVRRKGQRMGRNPKYQCASADFAPAGDGVQALDDPQVADQFRSGMAA